jgi:hypothetical protein
LFKEEFLAMIIIEAVKIMLYSRGESGRNYGKTWQTHNVRLRDGIQTEKMLSELLKELTRINLFDTYHPFQIM